MNPSSTPASSPTPPADAHQVGKARPWYREPALWLLMAGPVAVIVAGAVTLGLALGRPDGLVTADYYKRGLLVERRIERDATAARLGLRAALQWDAATGALMLSLQPSPETRQTPLLQLRHPSRAELDRKVLLVPQGDAAYLGEIRDLPAGRWDVILETDAWRLEGQWHWPPLRKLHLGEP